MIVEDEHSMCNGNFDYNRVENDTSTGEASNGPHIGLTNISLMESMSLWKNKIIDNFK